MLKSFNEIEDGIWVNNNLDYKDLPNADMYFFDIDGSIGNPTLNYIKSIFLEFKTMYLKDPHFWKWFFKTAYKYKYLKEEKDFFERDYLLSRGLSFYKLFEGFKQSDFDNFIENIERDIFPGVIDFSKKIKGKKVILSSNRTDLCCKVAEIIGAYPYSELNDKNCKLREILCDYKPQTVVYFGDSLPDIVNMKYLHLPNKPTYESINVLVSKKEPKQIPLGTIKDVDMVLNPNSWQLLSNLYK